MSDSIGNTSALPALQKRGDPLPDEAVPEAAKPANNLIVNTWRIEHCNTVDPYDGHLHEWWNVTNGTRSFRCNSKEDAEWLRDTLFTAFVLFV